MNRKKNIVILVIISLLIILGIIAVIFGRDAGEDNPKIESTIERLKNSDEFYTVQRVISNENHDVIFHAEEVYYNPNSKVTYYFTKGYETDRFEGSETNSKNCLVIVKDDYYGIVQLPQIDNMEEYAKNYKLENVNINSNKKFEVEKISEKSILSGYVAEFKNLSIIDSKKAYNMLGESTLKKYSTYESFKNNINSIYTSFSSVVFGYSVSYEGDYKYYKIKDSLQRDIEIIEYYPNDYKINF